MITGRDILFGVLLPAVIAALALLLGVMFRRMPRLRRALVPLGIGVAFAAGFGALIQRVPPVPPLDSVDWLFYAALVVGAVAAADAIFWDTRVARDAPVERASNVMDYSPPDALAPRAGFVAFAVRLIIVLALCAAIVWLLVRPLLVFNWIGRTGVFWITGIALTMALLWVALDALAARAGGRALALALAVVAGLTALTIMLSGSQKLGQLGGLLASAMFAVAVVGLFFPDVPVARGMVFVYAILQTSLLATAGEHVYANLTTRNAVLLLVAAPLGWLGLLVPARRPAARAAVQFAAAVAPAAVAAILAALAFVQASKDYSDFPG